MNQSWSGIRWGQIACGSAAAAGLLLTGCLTREVKEQEPTTSNVFIEQVRRGAINEIDLLFVIDNSSSMGDKQEILRRAVPQMVTRLVNPLCQNEDGETMTNPGECPDGFRLEFQPVNDIHIGVISSSLGGHGSRQCARGTAGRNNDDQAHLIPSMRPGTVDPTGQGFLAWTGGDDAVRQTLEMDFWSSRQRRWRSRLRLRGAFGGLVPLLD